MVSKQDVIKALKDCYDPEIPINVVDLGLIYDVSINSGKVIIEITLTAVGCPLSEIITDDIMQKVSAIEGVKNVDVKLVFDPPWTPEKMSSKARQQLGL
jgi:metal-sulfur cluster biosynthetic enzyme